MKWTPTWLFALLLSPAVATAQTHVLADPDPDSRGCQNASAAVHHDGAVVMVADHGQWLQHDRFRTQNGGQNGSGCETERIVRLSSTGEVVWSIELDEHAGPHGIARGDRVASMTALSDGSTVVVSTKRPHKGNGLPTLTRLDSEGRTVWKTETTSSPKFATGWVETGRDDALFVAYAMTNYAYEGGQFQLPGGRLWKLKKGERKTLLARLDTATGKLLWEKPIAGFATLISGAEGEALVAQPRFRRTTVVSASYRLLRYRNDGTKYGEGQTPWLQGEGMLSAQRRGDEVLMTMFREIVKDGRVDHRVGVYRVFELDGKLKHTREVSDQSVLAELHTASAPVRLISPTSCHRDVIKNYSCQSAAANVLTLKGTRGKAKQTVITIPNARFEYQKLTGVSTARGLWLRAHSYYRTPDREWDAPSVTMLYSPDGSRAPSSSPPFVWRPVPRKQLQAKTSTGLTF